MSMQVHGLHHLLQFLDLLFGNSILVMGIDAGKAKILVAGHAALLPCIGCEDSIVSMIMLDMDAMCEAEVLKCLLANDGLLSINQLLEPHKANLMLDQHRQLHANSTDR